MKDDCKNLVIKAVSASTSLGLLSENNAPSFSSDDIQGRLVYPILGILRNTFTRLDSTVRDRSMATAPRPMISCELFCSVAAWSLT